MCGFGGLARGSRVLGLVPTYEYIFKSLILRFSAFGLLGFRLRAWFMMWGLGRLTLLIVLFRLFWALSPKPNHKPENPSTLNP